MLPRPFSRASVAVEFLDSQRPRMTPFGDGSSVPIDTRVEMERLIDANSIVMASAPGGAIIAAIGSKLRDPRFWLWLYEALIGLGESIGSVLSDEYLLEMFDDLEDSEQAHVREVFGLLGSPLGQQVTLSVIARMRNTERAAFFATILTLRNWPERIAAVTRAFGYASLSVRMILNPLAGFRMAEGAATMPPVAEAQLRDLMVEANGALTVPMDALAYWGVPRTRRHVEALDQLQGSLMALDIRYLVWLKQAWDLFPASQSDADFLTLAQGHPDLKQAWASLRVELSQPQLLQLVNTRS